TIQFVFAKRIFGGIGESPKKIAAMKAAQLGEAGKKELAEQEEKEAKVREENTNRFRITDIILIVVSAVIGLLYIFNDPISEIGSVSILPQEFIFSSDVISGPNVIVLIGVALFLILILG